MRHARMLFTRTTSHLRQHGLAAAAFVCSLLALAGSSYAAFSIPANSVGGRQLKNHAIDPIKMDPKVINGSVRAWAIVGPNARVIAGGGKPKVTAAISDPGGYGIGWGVKLGRCATVVTVDITLSRPTEHVPIPGNPSVPFTAGYAVAASSRRGTFVQTYNQQGQPTPLGFDVAVIC